VIKSVVYLLKYKIIKFIQIFLIEVTLGYFLFGFLWDMGIIFHLSPSALRLRKDRLWFLVVKIGGFEIATLSLAMTVFIEVTLGFIFFALF